MASSTLDRILSLVRDIAPAGRVRHLDPSDLGMENIDLKTSGKTYSTVVDLSGARGVIATVVVDISGATTTGAVDLGYAPAYQGAVSDTDALTGRLTRGLVNSVSLTSSGSFRFVAPPNGSMFVLGYNCAPSLGTNTEGILAAGPTSFRFNVTPAFDSVNSAVANLYVWLV